MTHSIEISNLSKIYKLYNKPVDRIKENFSPTRKKYSKNFYALDNISFNVKKGETVGIIGKNGSGKSTLLKIITGVLSQSSGNINVEGKISALLELGAGFNPELTGMENIYMNGVLLGYSDEYIKGSIDEILDFADIGDFINQPVKTYSSGMFVRLAFAIAININPEILIIDEALSVGDMRFQQKCYRKIREIKKNGTVLFVSHDTGALANFCDRIIWLDNGRIYKEGKPSEILDEYQAFMSYDISEMESVSIYNDIDESLNDDNSCEIEKVTAKSFGNGKALFESVVLMDSDTKSVCRTVESGQKVIIEMSIKSYDEIEMPILGFHFKDSLGNILIVTNTHFEKVTMDKIPKNSKTKFMWKFTIPKIKSGRYSFDIALANGTYYAHEQVQWINDALIVIIKDSNPYQEGRGWLIPDDICLESL